MSKQPPIATGRYAEMNPSRFNVMRTASPRTRGWVVFLGPTRIAYFPTHAEAIAYADKEARRP